MKFIVGNFLIYFPTFALIFFLLYVAEWYILLFAICVTILAGDMLCWILWFMVLGEIILDD